MAQAQGFAETTAQLSATRTLVDATLPAGPRDVSYELRAIRSGLESGANVVTAKLAA
jgi:hypothetical protein